MANSGCAMVSGALLKALRQLPGLKGLPVGAVGAVCAGLGALALCLGWLVAGPESAFAQSQDELFAGAKAQACLADPSS